jgi:hypothetical protein
VRRSVRPRTLATEHSLSELSPLVSADSSGAVVHQLLCVGRPEAEAPSSEDVPVFNPDGRALRLDVTQPGVLRSHPRARRDHEPARPKEDSSREACYLYKPAHAGEYQRARHEPRASDSEEPCGQACISHPRHPGKWLPPEPLGNNVLEIIGPYATRTASRRAPQRARLFRCKCRTPGLTASNNFPMLASVRTSV